MIWITIAVVVLVFFTLLKFLTPRYLSYLMDRMVYRPQREIEFVLEEEKPPEAWHGRRVHQHMCGLIKYMRTSRWVDESDERRQEIIRQLQELDHKWKRR